MNVYVEHHLGIPGVLKETVGHVHESAESVCRRFRQWLVVDGIREHIPTKKTVQGGCLLRNPGTGERVQVVPKMTCKFV